jgi:hypothetical protein
LRALKSAEGDPLRLATRAGVSADANAASAGRSSNGDRCTDTNPGGQIIVRYWYALTPLVIVGTVVLLSLPWLGLIALMVVALFVVAALAWVSVWVSRVLSRAVSRRSHGRSGKSPRTAKAVRPASLGGRPTRSVPKHATVLLANPPSEGDA